ncbi:heavy-metal-associated domain-containing protein [Nitrosomonas sp. sh817]|mgnify:FL=1|jgi:copper chaperone|uniref:heavy-metal-associated domain-containing protein n=1 Tax=unclassified Nitrosomonas TaxID=2609265 RepID=UPI0027DDF629|nr:heavy metal-associated domain-containing protein [Nitrosomonas sp. sh817]WMJ07739.1 heavy metal-associated domain-containing protein [Nitrosomonas sp. sh817]
MTLETATIKIKGMTCMGCVNSIKNVLSNVPGVTQIEATLEPPQAIVHFDSAVTKLDRLKDAITDAGFEVVD